MGNSNNETAENYRSIKKEKHSVLGLIHYIETDLQSSPKRFTAKAKSYMNSVEMECVKGRIEKRMAVFEKQDAHILRIEHCRQREQKGYCTNIKQLEVLYSEIQEDLHQQYLFKKCNKEVFSQEEIVRLASQLLEGLKFANDNKLKVFHLSRKSIFKRGKEDYCMVLQEDAECSNPINDYITNFDGEMFSQNHFLSPKQLLGINEFCIVPEWTMKDHIFTLGMVLLNLCLMKELAFESEIISVKIDGEEKQFIFEESLIKKQLEKVRKMTMLIKYSEKMKNIIAKMLEFDENKRLTFDDLHRILNEKMIVKSTIEDIELKKTTKRLTWHRRLVESKENLNVIPPSLEHLQQKKKVIERCKSSEKQTINVYLDAKHLFQEINSVIATQAKDYKRAKMSSLKIDNICRKEVISEVNPKEQVTINIFTPIKKLHDDDNKDFGSNFTLFKGIKRCKRAESTYDIESCKSIKNSVGSKTSLAANLRRDF